MKYKPYQKVLVVVIPLAGIALLMVTARFILAHVTFSTCPALQYLHIYCPGCGSTRAVQALLSGDILLALRQNISVPVLSVIAALYYLEFAFKVFGVRFRISLLHDVKWMVCLLVLWFVYFFLRNFVPAIAPI